MPFHGGLDWGATAHAVCVIDAAGRVDARIEARHDDAGLADLLVRLRQIAPTAELPIAIERPSGLIVDALVEAGHPIIPIHPNVVKACRPRYRAAGGKSDPGDAYMLADILRTDGHRFRPLMPASRPRRSGGPAGGDGKSVAQPARKLLAGCGRHLRRDRQPDRARLRRTLSDPAQCQPPGREAPGQFHGPACLLRASLAHRAGQRRRGRGQGRTRLRAGRRARAPRGRDRQAFGAHRTRRGRSARRPHRHVVSAHRTHLPDRGPLAAEAGVCPVTHASGKSLGVVFRWACNKNLRLAITCFADNSRHASAWARGIYRRARDRGCKHAHAVRILARAWVRVLWRVARRQAIAHAGAVRIA